MTHSTFITLSLSSLSLVQKIDINTGITLLLLVILSDITTWRTWPGQTKLQFGSESYFDLTTLALSRHC